MTITILGIIIITITTSMSIFVSTPSDVSCQGITSGFQRPEHLVLLPDGVQSPPPNIEYLMLGGTRDSNSNSKQ